jgi:hypothetical protein
MSQLQENRRFTDLQNFYTYYLMKSSTLSRHLPLTRWTRVLPRQVSTRLGVPTAHQAISASASHISPRPPNPYTQQHTRPISTAHSKMTTSSVWATSSFIAISRALPHPTAEIAHFNTIPTLQSWLTNPSYSPLSTATRLPRTDGENDFFAITLQTPTTIPHWLLLVHDEHTTPLPPNSAPTPKKPTNGTAASPDMLLLLTLSRGTNGFLATAHGGLLSALFDEALSFCAEFARQARSTARNPLFTANLSLDFRRPVVTAGANGAGGGDGDGVGVVVLKCWTEKVEGRKYWLKAIMEDVLGRCCVEARGLWIEARDGVL